MYNIRCHAPWIDLMQEEKTPNENNVLVTFKKILLKSEMETKQLSLLYFLLTPAQIHALLFPLHLFELLTHSLIQPDAMDRPNKPSCMPQ